MPRVYQPDPPGLIHDDPRLLPPWRGSSLLQGCIEQKSLLFGLRGALISTGVIQYPAVNRCSLSINAQPSPYPQIVIYGLVTNGRGKPR